jgi:hypothetical protein
VVYLPAAPTRGAEAGPQLRRLEDGAPTGGAQAWPELRRLEDGRLALPAFSALDRLVEGCGEAQPWILVPATEVESIGEASGCNVVLLDLPLPAGLRRTSPQTAPEAGR